MRRRPPESGPLNSISSSNTLNLGFEIRDHVKEALVEAAVRGDGVLDGNVGDVEAVKDGDAAPFLLVHHVDGVQAVALRENAVVGSRNSTALGMAQIHRAGFIAGFLFNQLGERFANAGEANVAEGVDLLGTGDLADLGEMATLGDHDDTVMLAVIVVVFQQRANVLDVDFFFRNENDMGASGDSASVGDPARIAAHYFND